MGLTKLKSGSDIRGVAIATENSEITLTDEAVIEITYGFYAWLKERKYKDSYKIAIGHDSRLSAKRIKDCIIKTLKNIGTTVYDCGLSSTPAMFMITLDDKLDADASMQITASHHPYDKNGIKFFTKDGGLESDDITSILRQAKERVRFTEKEGEVKKVNFMKTYSKQLVDFVVNKTKKKKPLLGYKIIVDAGNGAGGFFAKNVLEVLGADTTGSQFLEPDGNFPNHVPNPENKEAMESICNAVKKHKADFGIIFDTDVDRAGAVDSFGNEINRNSLIALISSILLSEKAPATIVTDSVTSDGLREFIQERNGIHYRYMRGYKNVINECKRLNAEGIYCPLAIETSGHAAFSENYFLDDGAYLITRLLASLSENKNLQTLIKDLKMPVEETEVRLGFHTSEYKDYGNYVMHETYMRLKNDPNVTISDDSKEGVRVNFSEDGKPLGFALIRLSVHDPIMPVNIESNIKGGTKIIANKMYEALKTLDQLNIIELEKII